MPRSRVILISVCILAVLGAAVVILALTGGDGAEPAVSPPPIIDNADLFDLLNLTNAEVKNVSFSGGGLSYTVTRDSDGELTMAASRALFPFQPSVVTSVFNSAIRLTQLKRAAANADDAALAGFGLDDPAMVWNISLADGSAVRLALSEKLLARYVHIVGQRDVYILEDYQADRLCRPLEQFYDLSFLPEYITPATEEEYTWGWFTRFALTAPGREIEIRRAGAEFSEGYKMYLPAETDINQGVAVNSFFIPITTVKPSELVEINPADLSKYGLDNPVRLELNDEEGWSGTLLIGRKNETNDGQYVMIEGKNAVLLDKSGDYIFTETPYFRLRLGLIWSHNIDTVRSVDYHLDGTSRRLVLSHGDPFGGDLDGKELSESDTRRLYASVLGIFIDGETDADIPAAPPEYRFVITLTDGGSHTLELYALNERQFLFVLDGENQRLITYKTTLTTSLLDKFDLLDQGIELPR